MKQGVDLTRHNREVSAARPRARQRTSSVIPLATGDKVIGQSVSKVKIGVGGMRSTEPIANPKKPSVSEQKEQLQ